MDRQTLCKYMDRQALCEVYVQTSYLWSIWTHRLSLLDVIWVNRFNSFLILPTSVIQDISALIPINSTLLICLVSAVCIFQLFFSFISCDWVVGLAHNFSRLLWLDNWGFSFFPDSPSWRGYTLKKLNSITVKFFLWSLLVKWDRRLKSLWKR